MLCVADATRRARPFLGTLVSIEVEGLDEREATRAIDAAFDEVNTIHALMSFHASDSDVSRLNRDAHAAPVKINARTFEVLSAARAFSQASDGMFDICVAPLLIEAGALPSLEGAVRCSNATWRDIELDPQTKTVRFQRPLALDLGGIAKGYAVDRAVAVLRDAGAEQICVNAGGDLAVHGPRAESVQLRAPGAPVLALSNAALASSLAAPDTHFDATTRTAASACSFAAIVAERCIDADALTKIVLARGAASADLLTRGNATAYIYDGAWRTIGAQP